jgi:E3 ubiquitin-protein ligase HECTD1
MLHYIAPEQLQQLQEESTPASGSTAGVSSNFFSQLVQVLASVLDSEEDEDGHLTALHIIEDLMQKSPEVFLDHFARLGIFQKVLNLAGPAFDDDADAACPPSDEKEEGVEEATAIVQGKPYHWKEWCLARGRDCLYLWCDAAALELSNGSNGWFRFILDGKLATMYSSGSPEGGSDSSGML